MNKKTSAPLTDQEKRQARRAWQRLTPQQRQAVRALLHFLEGTGNAPQIHANPLADALLKDGKQ